MTTLKAICTATVLTLALSVTTLAGEISSPGSPTPAPSGTAPCDMDTPTVTSVDPGDIDTPGFAYILWDLISMF